MMLRQIRRTRQVREDLIDIYGYIHDRSPRSAEKVFSAIERNIRGLLSTLGVGRYWSTSDPRLDGMRMTVAFPYRNYLIFFRSVEERIEVFRVVHGARNLEKVIDEMEFEWDDG